MTRTGLDWRPVTNCGLVVLAFGVLACERGVVPDFAVPFDSATPTQIRAYVSKLHFDEREGSGDEERLTVGCPSACRAGPVVQVLPEIRSHKNDDRDLEGSPGRIIARLINRDKQQDYPALNLAAADTVYWAVDRVKRVSKDLSEGRSFFISAQGLRGGRDSVAVQRRLYIDEHPGQPAYTQALARWLPAKTGSQGASLASARGMSTTQTGAQVQDQTQQELLYMKPLALWNSCKIGGCCR
jgi:hypothetical protein